MSFSIEGHRRSSQNTAIFYSPRQRSLRRVHNLIMIRGTAPTLFVTARVLWSLTASKTSAYIDPYRCFHHSVSAASATSFVGQNNIPALSPSSSRLFSNNTPTTNMAEAEEKTLQDLLDFWYPPPSDAVEGNKDFMSDLNFINSRINDWFAGGDEMDEKCRAFRELIRREKKEYSKDDDTSMSEACGKIVLFDQITRNAFRREDEAFAYEDVVGDILGNIFQVKEGQTTITEDGLSAFVDHPDVHFSDGFFVAVACQHQEKPIFHGVDRRLYDVMDGKWPDGKDFLKMAKGQADEHYEVLKRFGRYPHRNPRKGREDSPEEKEWLSDYDNLPAWAKSQLSEKE